MTAGTATFPVDYDAFRREVDEFARALPPQDQALNPAPGTPDWG